MAHIHLKAYFELALHDKNDHHKADGTHHDPKEQLGRGETTHSIAVIIRIRERENNNNNKSPKVYFYN